MWINLSGQRCNPRTCGVRSDGTLWCWGQNIDIDPDLELALTEPTQIGTDTDWVSVSVGDQFHICGVKTDGSVTCFGRNRFGALGGGTTGDTDYHPPQSVAGPWQTVKAGYFHTCGLRADGSMLCWGTSSVFTELGGTTTPTPVETDKRWQAFDMAPNGFCGVTDAGELWCAEADGEASPIRRVGTRDDWSTVALSNDRRHVCASTRSGELHCAWNNELGQLGNGRSGARYRPSRVGAENDWTRVELSQFESCGLRGEALWCWGRRIGEPIDIDTQQVPAAVATPEGLTDVALGYGHRCAIGVSGALHCVGRDDVGQLARGSAGEASESWVQVGGDTDWTEVASAPFSEATCGVRGGELHCWGFGYGPELTRIGAASDWTALDLSTDGDLGCGLRSSGGVWCWDTASDPIEPIELAPPAAGEMVEGAFVALTMRQAEACAITDAGQFWCGSLAFELRDELEQEFPLVGADMNRDGDVCALREDGTMFCESDDAALLGTGDPPGTAGAILDATDWRQVRLTRPRACALKGEGELWCWGSGADGALGVGGAFEAEMQRVRFVGR